MKHNNSCEYCQEPTEESTEYLCTSLEDPGRESQGRSQVSGRPLVVWSSVVGMPHTAVLGPWEESPEADGDSLDRKRLTWESELFDPPSGTAPSSQLETALIQESHENPPAEQPQRRSPAISQSHDLSCDGRDYRADNYPAQQSSAMLSMMNSSVTCPNTTAMVMESAPDVRNYLNIIA